LSPLRRSRSATSRARTGRSPTASAAGILIADPKGPRRSNGEALEEPLTPRETDVLELLAEGLANKPIAARLGISDQTLKFHVASICGKLGAANRTDAVRRAVRRGLVSL
jgi:DNA-binding NarL/FixJ family response regulator